MTAVGDGDRYAEVLTGLMQPAAPLLVELMEVDARSGGGGAVSVQSLSALFTRSRGWSAWEELRRQDVRSQYPSSTAASLEEVVGLLRAPSARA